MRTNFRALALLLFSVLLTGCYFDHPLTSAPSDDLNTWLLGVWESKDEKGRTLRAGVMPLTADRYTIWYRILGKRPQDTKEWRFEAWPSRVGNSTFLSLKCEKSAGDIPVGAFVFVHCQVLDQLHVITRPLQLDSGPSASSFELRKEVRAKLKDRTLLPEMGTVWTRIAEVYWRPGDEGEGSFEPTRFPPTP
jgi:hypothetical protein